MTVPAGDPTVDVTLSVPAATAGARTAAGLSFHEVAGLVSSRRHRLDNGGITLRVPYYLVPRAAADV